jgi:hypothetical protein
MAYGSVGQVQIMASTWTDDGVFTTTTNPSIAEVAAWLDEVSAQFDIALGSHQFVFPVMQSVSPTAYKAIGKYIVDLVADLCNWKNSSGRFFTEKLMERGVTPMAAILKDINNWIETNADGLVADNVPQIEKQSIHNQPHFRVLGDL